MPSLRIKKELKDSIYFVTLTVYKWYYLFDRQHRWELLLNTFRYYQEKSDLKIYAWVFMLNHIHFIFQNSGKYDFLRSFKSYTSHELIKDLKITEPVVLKYFKSKKGYRLWNKTNYPILLESEYFFNQKINYIENNPVSKNYVYNAKDWKYSSANRIQLLNVTRFD